MRAGIPSSDQKISVVAARTLSKGMDVRRTHDMHGERVSVDHQQHDVEPPPNDVEQEPLKMKRSMDEKKLWDRKERLNENTLKNEEERQSKKARREVTQLLDEKELQDEKQLIKEQKRLNEKELLDEKEPRNEEP